MHLFNYQNHYDGIQMFFDVISHKSKLIELTLNFEMDLSCLSSDCNNEDRRKVMTTLLYEQALPLITNMFGSHTNMKFVTIYRSDHDKSISQPNWTKQIELFWQVKFLHHSLQFVEISVLNKSYWTSNSSLVTISNSQSPSLLENILASQQKIFLERNKEKKSPRALLLIKLK